MYKLFKSLAILGNVLFGLWILYNGIDEGFKASPMQLTSYLVLWSLLIINIVLLSLSRVKGSTKLE